jgi:hypothetical protein
MWVEFLWFRIGSEHNSGPSVSIKDGKFLGLAERLSAYQNGFAPLDILVSRYSTVNKDVTNNRMTTDWFLVSPLQFGTTRIFLCTGMITAKVKSFLSTLFKYRVGAEV